MKVVRPEWIVASVEAGRVLPVEDFGLEALRDAGAQRLEAVVSDIPSPKRPRTAPLTEREMQERAEAKELAYFRDGNLTPAAFIKSYFEHSRLHFIGTWKMRIEAFTQRHKHKGPKPLRTSQRGK